MASFLHDAKARIQHTNKLSLAPKDLKNLADVISTEKNVLSTASKLSVDYRKSAEALKEWGLNEGDDLGDILPKLSILFGHLADAQARFSDHDGTYRIHFKSIRMREESLSTLKKSRETIQGKIVGFEKKITKMSSENKDLPALTTRLQESRAELVSLENSIAIEEARLSDFKRETVREGLSLRLGAMLELAEKMTIVCEFGRMLTAQVPTDRTPPGSGRAPYCAASKTQAIVEEAQQCLTQVVFNPTPVAARGDVETLPGDQFISSPQSDHQHPATPQVSQSFPSELPPLYFGASLVNSEKPMSAGDSPNYARHTGRSEAPTLHNHLPSQSYVQEQNQNTGYANSSFHPPSNKAELSTAPLPLPPHGSFGLEGGSSYADDAFYVLDRDGVPQSTGPGTPPELIQAHPSSAQNNPTEYIQSHPSSSPRPANSSLSEVPRLAGGHPPDHHTGPREYPSGSSTADVPRAPEVTQSRGSETGSNTSERLTYSPRHHEISLSTRSPGAQNTEGRTTNAGAFRRAMGSNVRPSASNQSMINTDEALSTGATTSVHPLHIHKRESRGIQQ